MKPKSGIKAVNQNVFVLRDEIEDESGGLLLPTTERKKPHKGVIISCGKLVADPDVKSGIGKKAVFHQGTGQEVEYNGDVFIVLHSEHILGVE